MESKKAIESPFPPETRKSKMKDDREEVFNQKKKEKKINKTEELLFDQVEAGIRNAHQTYVVTTSTESSAGAMSSTNLLAHTTASSDRTKG